MIWKDNSSLNKEDIEKNQVGAVSYIINKSLRDLTSKHPGLVIYPNVINNDTLDQCVLKGYYQNHENMSIQTTNLIGVLSVPIDDEGNSQTISIGSRFDNSKQQSFLIYLLSSVFEGIFLDWKTEDSQDDFFDLILILMFLDLLQKQARQGFPRFYITRLNNDYNIRGRLNINQHIKSNVPFLGKIAYETREHSYDNNFMWLIRYTLDKIKLKHRQLWGQLTNSSLRNIINFIEQETRTYTLGKFHQRFSEMFKPVTHPLYKDLEVLRKICLQIIRGEGINIYGSKSSEVYGILFDIAWLWEAFLDNIIKKIIEKPFEHLIPGEKGIKVFNEKKSINFYPDFVSLDGNVILDAKYKFWSETKNFDDVHQILSYMYLLNSKVGGVIFPSQKPSSLVPETFKLNTPNGDSEFKKIFFSIPNPNRDDFAQKMGDEEKVLIKKIKNL